jgi:flagella basal body P-ring formation protein FlgA
MIQSLNGSIPCDMEVAMLTPNGRISKRKTVQLMIALTILAWATQTLLHQWGFGAEISAASIQDDASAEKFVPSDATTIGATIEMRNEATIVGAEVKLKQVCRWSDADAAALAPIAELVVARITPGKPFKSISVNEIKSILQDAKVNLAGINFVGAMSCTIDRSDASVDEGQAMQQWIAARTVDAPDATPATAPAAPAKPQAASPVRTLRDILTADLAQRLNLQAETLQMDFKPLDDNVLNLSEPLFKFQIEPQRVRNLGPVEWDVTVISGNGNKKVTIDASARAWETQAILTKPLGYNQLIQDGDVIEKRVLVDAMPDDPLVTKQQAVGQQASRVLTINTVLNSRMLSPVELVKNGQFVTITVSHGAVSIKTVARAMEGGSLGQTIKVKNETTKDIYDVVLTGPQQAALNADAPQTDIASTN